MQHTNSQGVVDDPESTASKSVAGSKFRINTIRVRQYWNPNCGSPVN